MQVWLDFEGVQSFSSYWLNGAFLGNQSWGSTPSRFYIGPGSGIPVK